MCPRAGELASEFTVVVEELVDVVAEVKAVNVEVVNDGISDVGVGVVVVEGAHTARVAW